MKEEILSAVMLQHKQSGGSCGTYLKDLSQDLGISLNELKEILKEINGISIRPSIHGEMVMKSKKK